MFIHKIPSPRQLIKMISERSTSDVIMSADSARLRMPSMAAIFLVISWIAIAATPAHAKDYILAPKGDYATIDTTLSNNTIKILMATRAHENDAIIHQITNNSSNYQPPVFYALANLLFRLGNVDDAIFWLHAGQLRAGFDAMRCTDKSATSMFDALQPLIPIELNKAQFRDPDKLRATINKVISWDEETPHNYDQRWINLHGMKAMVSALGKGDDQAELLSVPREQWDELAKQRRQNYRDSLEKAFAIIAARHNTQ